MKIVYICECCDCLVAEIDPDVREKRKDSVLTLPGLQNIINTDLSDYLPQQAHNNLYMEDKYILPSLCEDCHETLYGSQETFRFREQRLH
ncbi:MAG TPA: hypothetical protein DCM26_04475 [Desulfotomaculum sp.]|nr:hypothetical protein [Desulfotomaculum sp.]